MAFGSILGSVKGIMSGNIFGFGSDAKAYPTDGIIDVNAVTNYKSEYAQEWKKNAGYAFQVVRTDPDGYSFNEPGWSEFRLQLNPQELSQDEIFAIEVTPTLRGVLVEHHGQILKDIMISGTTGISPNRAEGGASNDGRPVLQVGRSGYEEFHELRSYFRMYVETKRATERSENSGELRLIFKNFKDGEYLYVEPMKFGMKRSAKRPHLYDYQIQMKGIGVANNTNFGDTSFMGMLESLDESLDNALGYLDEAQRLIKGGFAIINRFQRDINAILLAPTLAVRQAIAAVRGGKAMTLTQMGVTRRAIDDLRNITREVKANFNDGIGRATAEYNRQVGRTSTLQGNPNRVTTYEEHSVLNGLNKLDNGLLLVAGLQDKVFEKNVAQANADVVASYSEGKINIPTPAAVKQVDIQDGDDVQTIATRLLGSPDRFKEIVVLNNLKAPYISATGGPGVLKFGDKILIPKQSGTGSSGVIKNKEYNISADLIESEKNMGVDIRLTPEGDLAVSNTKDLDLIAGMENMSQAVSLKFAYEKGSLKRHKQIGTSLEIGRKVGNNLEEIRDEIVSSFGADNRVQNIPFITLRQEGNTTFINMLLKLKGADQPVPLPLVIKN